MIHKLLIEPNPNLVKVIETVTVCTQTAESRRVASLRSKVTHHEPSLNKVTLGYKKAEVS